MWRCDGVTIRPLRPSNILGHSPFGRRHGQARSSSSFDFDGRKEGGAVWRCDGVTVTDRRLRRLPCLLLSSGGRRALGLRRFLFLGP